MEVDEEFFAKRNERVKRAKGGISICGKTLRYGSIDKQDDLLKPNVKYVSNGILYMMSDDSRKQFFNTQLCDVCSTHQCESRIKKKARTILITDHLF